MPIPPNPGLRNLRDTTQAQAGLRPLIAAPSFADRIPAGYTSPDVVDLRNAQPHPLMDKLRGLVQSVKDDYHESFPQPINAIYGPGDTIPAYGTDAATSPSPGQQVTAKRVVR
jgi:hypothetical protein